jgi:hypothetical protein
VGATLAIIGLLDPGGCEEQVDEDVGIGGVA